MLLTGRTWTYSKGGGERDFRKSIAVGGKNLDILKLDGGEANRKRESPTSEAEAEQLGGDRGRNRCYRCGKEHCFNFNHTFRLTACSDPCACYGPLTGKSGATETKRVRRRCTSLFSDVQYEANEDEVKALEGARRSDRTCIPSILIAESRIDKWSERVTECVETHNSKAKPIDGSCDTVQVSIHEKTQGKCTEVLGQMLGDRFHGEHKQATKVAKITVKEDIAVYCINLLNIEQTSDATQ